MAYQWAELAEIAQRLDEVAEVKRSEPGALQAQADWRGGDPPFLV
jgi:hypothetical protein